MKKNILFIMIISLMIIFAGCENSTSKGNQNGYSLDSFNGGNSALEFNFIEGYPPKNIRDQSLVPFNVMLNIKNVGEFDIPDDSAFVRLDGFNPADLGLNDTTQAIMSLNGVKKQGKNIIPGRESRVSFTNLKFINSVVGSNMPIKIFANICYPYQTKSVGIICINGNTVPSIDEKTEICKLDGEKKFSNSGGPVKIENLKQYPHGKSSIQLSFDIVHDPSSDQASLFEPGSIDENCYIGGKSASSPSAVFKKNKVKFTVETGVPGLKCNQGDNSGFVTLSNDRTIVTCIQDTTGQEEYQKQITITLDYDYLDRKSIDINVEHVQLE